MALPCLCSIDAPLVQGTLWACTRTLRTGCVRNGEASSSASKRLDDGCCEDCPASHLCCLFPGRFVLLLRSLHLFFPVLFFCRCWLLRLLVACRLWLRVVKLLIKTSPRRRFPEVVLESRVSISVVRDAFTAGGCGLMAPRPPSERPTCH